MTRTLFASFAAITVTVPFFAGPLAAGAVPVPPPPPSPSPSASAAVPADDVASLIPDRLTLNGKPLPPASYTPKPAARRAAADTPAIGTVRSWAGLNVLDNDVYRKDYTLRAVGTHIEMWVANDLTFPAGDCRGNATEITDAQLGAVMREFDENIYPKETAAFSTPPDRTGANAGLPGDFTGAGNRTVTLVDNIRDGNYVEFPANVTYVSGFFSEQLNELFDRNIITIDAYDWAHQTGANPAHEPTDDRCTSRPARPRMYESTFAHEWLHLLSYYTDPDDDVWIDEGLSEYAQTLTGYVDPSLNVYRRGFDNHIACYQGFGGVKTAYNPNPRACSAPANSLNLWKEGKPDEVLADYGIAYELMIYLRDRFGAKALTALHKDTKNKGLAGIAAALPKGTELYDVLHDFQIMTLVDKAVGRPDGVMKGLPRKRVTAPGLRSTVNLSDDSAFGAPGAAPNGADFVRLPRELRSIDFKGAVTLPPTPLSWKTDAAMLFSGNEPATDETAVRAVDVPAADPVLRLTTTYGLEKDFDYGYVTVSADGGKTYQPVEGDRTVKGPLGAAITGQAADVTLSYDLSAHAGKSVLLGFRYVSDAAVSLGGWHIWDVKVGATTVDSATLDGWRSPTQVRPTPVHNWHVTLVGLGTSRAKAVGLADFDKLGTYPKTVAVIAYDEPTGTVTQYAPYTLTVNGEVQPGGSAP
ncbi:peptidase M6 immune inhibitor A [Actinoplanes sp. GCM10030250]|uniref:peptidase M6 immune inhibitor A n=1 Tax=Actinoplanes sp. GCM10030250 TaxID=3273376 RepID=UPI00361B7536